jgi:hypothetical protein
MKQALLAFAEHRPETVSHASALMREHGAVFLEEPPDSLFVEMLAGDLAVDEYVMTLDTEYPEFNHAMCIVLRELHREGISIYQVEPYLEHLVSIHEFFSSGGSPEDLDPHIPQYQVYLREKEATAALLDFYRTATDGTFQQTVGSVKRFARIDSSRFVFRDRLRAEALAPMIQRYAKSYIEAGQIHFILLRMLRQTLVNTVAVKGRFLMDPVVKTLGISRHLFGPGDILTLRYMLRPDIPDPMEDLLAARALIYNKVIRKDETIPSKESYPHVRDELEVIETVKQLRLAECADLFPDIRRLKTEEARTVVAQHLRATGRNAFSRPASKRRV